MLLKAISLSHATANYHANLGMVVITLKITGVYYTFTSNHPMACRNKLHNLSTSLHYKYVTGSTFLYGIFPCTSKHCTY